MNPIKAFFSFIINDFKTDYEFVRDVFNGKRKIDLKKTDFKQFSITKMLKDCWTWYLIIVLAFFCGAFVSSQYFQDSCNTFIQEEILPQCTGHGYGNNNEEKWVFLDENNKKVNGAFNLNNDSLRSKPVFQ